MKAPDLANMVFVWVKKAALKEALSQAENLERHVLVAYDSALTIPLGKS